jgi:hypothetical protein
MQLKIKKFNPKSIKQHRIILIIGRRGSGKSTLCADILYHIRDNIDFGVFMTPTEESAESFRKCVPDSWVYDSYNPQKLEEMLRIQRMLSRTNKQRNLLCVLDDCMYDPKTMKGVAMRDLHMNGRHLKCQFVNCVQYLIDVPPAIRSQCDYIVVLKEPIHSNQVKLWKYFFGIFSNFKDFSAVLSRCTDNFSALVLDNTSPTSELDDCLFWYRANQNLPDFKIGKQIYWDLSRKHALGREEQERRVRATHMHRQMRTHETSKDARVTLVQRQDRSGKIIKEDDDVVRFSV